MDILNRKEMDLIVQRYGNSKVSKWTVENYSDTLIGHLGEHLRLIVEFDCTIDDKKQMIFFVKCLPRFDKWKKEILNDLGFFKREYLMLSRLFKNFTNEGINKWSPTVLYAREDLLVFEDAAQAGYSMPNNRNTFDYAQTMAVVETVAKFHAQSLIYEHKKSQELKRPYRIWEDFSNYLQETDKKFRNTGRNAAIDFLIEYSTYKSEPDFANTLKKTVTLVFDEALQLTKPSVKYRNAIIHRDLWSNNILFKKLQNGKTHALIVDFQTILYTAPMIDLAIVLFMNTTKTFRNSFINDVLDCYYDTMSQTLKNENLDIELTFENKNTMKESFEESIVVGITQAAIVLPLTVMTAKKRDELFCDEDSVKLSKLSFESRGQQVIEIAREDNEYKIRVTELLDDIVERYIFTESQKNKQIIDVAKS